MYIYLSHKNQANVGKYAMDVWVMVFFVSPLRLKT